MGETYRLVEGPAAGYVEIEGNAGPEVGIVLAGNSAGRLAVYRFDPIGKHYQFAHVGRLARLHGGLDDGLEMPVANDQATIERRRTRHGKPTSMCRYERRAGSDCGVLDYDFAEYFDYLTEEDHSIIASEAFYKKPNYEIYSLKPGFHTEVLVEAGHRRATVDGGIAEVIKAVWGRGWETLGSCESLPPGRKNTGRAYVSFPVRRHAKEFAEALEKHGIDCRLRDTIGKKATLDRNGKVFRRFEVPSGSVLFAPRDFDRIVAALLA